MKKYFFAVLFAIISSSVFAANASCDRPGQDGCWDLLILNVKWDKSLSGLDKEPASAEDRIERVKTLGPRLMDGYQAGVVQAAQPRSFIVVLWGLGNAKPASYKVNGRKADGGKVSDARIEDVTGKVPYPKTVKMEKVKELGKPSKIYRIYAEGKDPIGVSIQFPWKALEKTTILVHAEDDLTVSPRDNKETDNGSWVPPSQHALVRQAGKNGSILPVISEK